MLRHETMNYFKMKYYQIVITGRFNYENRMDDIANIKSYECVYDCANKFVQTLELREIAMGDQTPTTDGIAHIKFQDCVNDCANTIVQTMVVRKSEINASEKRNVKIEPRKPVTSDCLMYI